MIPVNQGDVEDKGGLECYGHSRILSPSGIVVAEAESEEGLVIAKINVKEEIRKGRAVTFFGLNFIKDRMPETYQYIASKSIYYPPVRISSKTVRGVNKANN